MAREIDPPDPYIYGLTALGRRELTSHQLRDRLRRKGCEAGAIEAAIQKLQRDGVLDDTRTARAFVRTESAIKRRGPLRIRRSLETMGVERDIARKAVEDGFEDRPVEDVLEEALRRKLRGPIVDARHAQRLIGYLVRQGFDVASAVAAVRRAEKQ